MNIRVSGNGHWFSSRRLRLVLAGLAVLAFPWPAVAVCGGGGAATLPAPTVVPLRGYRAGLQAPARIASDATDNVYIADPEQSQVLVRAASGRVIARARDLGNPVSVAVDAGGNVLVGDGVAGSVTAYSANWQPQFALGQGNGEFTYPSDISIDGATGNIFVTDSNAHVVRVYDAAGTFQFSFGGLGSADGQLNYPTGIFVDSAAGQVLVGDQRNYRVQIFDLAGTPVYCFGQQGRTAGRFNMIQGLWKDGTGRIYVADGYEGRVQVLDGAGNFVAYIGEIGKGRGQMRVPSDLLIDANNRLFVTSSNNARVEMFGVDTYSDPESFVFATLKLDPGSFDRAHPPTVVAAYLALPGYAPEEIVTDSVRINGLPANPSPITTGDVDGDGSAELRLELDGGGLLATLPEGESTVAASGNTSTMQFEASARAVVQTDPCGGGCTLGDVDPGCNRAVCVPGQGCVLETMADGSACSDADACTTGGSCQAGVCVGAGPRSCDDGNLCTDDSCDAGTGCLHVNNTLPCDDADACTTADTCGGGVCVGAAVGCDDGNGCTDDSCDSVAGCLHDFNAAPCDDDNACTAGDVCSGGFCTAGMPLACDDGNMCTVDSCHPATGCVNDLEPGCLTSTPTTTPTLTPTPTPTIFLGGTLLYYANDAPVPGASVDGRAGLGGAVVVTAQSDASGAFAVTGVPAAPWAVVPHFTDTTASIARGVSSLDATWVQQTAIGSRTLNAAQQLACDTTGNGALSSLDAVRIQEFRIGLRGRMPVAVTCGSDWAFLPEPGPQGNPTPVVPQIGAPCDGAIGYDSISATTTGQDFRAVLFGDCTGNWTPPAGGGAAVLAEALNGDEQGGAPDRPAATVAPPPCDGSCVVALPDRWAANESGRQDVILAVNNLNAVQAFDLTVALPAGHRVVAVGKADLAARAGDCSLVWAAEESTLRISLACVTPVDGGGALLAVTLQGAGDGKVGVSGCVLEEGEVPCETAAAIASDRGSTSQRHAGW